MKNLQAILATTHVDAHGDVLAMSALVDLVEQINGSYLPVWVEHDPRIPPLGRFVSAEICALEGGHHGVRATAELFEDGDEIPFSTEGRRTAPGFYVGDRVAVVDDRAFRSEDDQTLIAAIRADLEAERRTAAKKALEPIAVLTIALTVAAANIGAGFLQKVGADAWDAVRPKLARLFGRRRDVPSQLLAIHFTVDVNSSPRLIELIVTAPQSADLAGIDQALLDQIGDRAKRELSVYPFLDRFVFTYSRETGLRLEFAVTMNGCPVLFDAARAVLKDRKGISFGGEGA